MPDKLPKGWVKTSLGEIRRDASSGISQQEMRGETFELYSVPAFEDRKREILPGEKIGSNKITVAPGDVLLCRIG
jgi:type I restriction enzyme, S subunit